jgi:allantoate deiminase
MAGHAGTVPMTLRKDALVGAAEFVLAVEAVGGSVPNLVATVGKLEVAPGASNVIAGEAEVSLDLRHPDRDVRDRAIEKLRSLAADIAKRRGLDVQWIDMPSFQETPCDPALTGLLREAIQAEGFEPIGLFSGAGHDAITMSRIAPVTMMFVRCKDGISHNPAESIVVSDVEVAMRVLNRLLRMHTGQR